MKVLVTGAGGFIGSHLVEFLVSCGYDVRALCQYNSNSSSGWLSDSILRDIEVQLGDVRDTGFVQDLTKGVDVVLHLAALVAIPYSYAAPRSYADTNIGGTLNILEAVRKFDCKLIHTSTSEIYGTPEKVPIDVSHAFRPQSPYAASKAAADHLVKSFVDSFSLQATIIRPFNTYGPRQSRRAVIPTILSQCLLGNEIEIGNTQSVRDFTFVTDTVRAFELAIHTSQIYNGRTIQLGTGNSVSILDLIKEISKVTEKKLSIKQSPERLRPPTSEVDILLSDPTQARSELGWKAQVDLQSGLEWTWKWIQEQRLSYRNVQSYAR